ncbi:MAG: tetratricopeptide repeat protein [Bacteroidota bacterium]
MKTFFSITLGLLFFSCQSPKNENIETYTTDPVLYEAISLLGDTLSSPSASDRLLVQYDEKKAIYEADSSNVENIIWFGRFTAYKGDYQDAIRIYSRGIELFPEDARLLRHRGHRYITIRQYEEAIADLARASEMIVDKENEIEPDGMPNAQNIPVSTLHGNIYYHLGLAYYLQNDLKNALTAYQNCLNSGDYDDNIVSATHWIHSILCRMGRDESETYLAPIDKDLDIIENHSYHKLCLFYKGLIDEEELTETEKSFSANDAVQYGLGNWYLCQGDTAKAKNIFEQLISSKGWNSFGYIAAEADLARMKGEILEESAD